MACHELTNKLEPSPGSIASRSVNLFGKRRIRHRWTRDEETRTSSGSSTTREGSLQATTRCATVASVAKRTGESRPVRVIIQSNALASSSTANHWRSYGALCDTISELCFTSQLRETLDDYAGQSSPRT